MRLSIGIYYFLVLLKAYFASHFASQEAKIWKNNHAGDIIIKRFTETLLLLSPNFYFL